MKQRFLTISVLLGTTLIGIPATFITIVYASANGMTGGSVALAAATVLVFMFAVAMLSSRWRRVALVMAGLACLVGISYSALRLKRVAPAPRMQICVNSLCEGRGPWLARVPPEHEAARAGLYLSGVAGLMGGAEFDAFDRLLDREYARLDGDWVGLPNALLLRSSSGRIWYYRHVPETEGRHPCIVFLHGFGGQLTPYLRVIAESELGRDFVVLAPVLDVSGRWWTSSGMEVVERLLRDHLPDEVDPSRVFLVGLSNGGVGATAIATDARTRGLFRGAVLVSGIGVARGDAGGMPFLVISGSVDPRFDPTGVTELTGRLERAGADVTSEWYDADHFLMLTHAPQWTHVAHEWILRSAVEPDTS